MTDISGLDYKRALKDRVRELSTRAPNPMTLRKLARHLEMQYTYLSRVLNSKDEHLKEDNLFEALNFLEFPATITDLMMNSRIVQGSTSKLRKEQAAKRISILQAKQFQQAEERGKVEAQMVAETAYLLDPLATIVFVSLTIDLYRKDPRKLMDAMSLKRQDLIQLLDKIEAAGLIERGENQFEIKKINSPRLNFRPDHQFVGLHQQQIKLLALGYAQKLQEDRKRSFMVTFAADAPAFEKIKQEFNVFIGKVEEISRKSRAKKTYQLMFDFFDWV